MNFRSAVRHAGRSGKKNTRNVRRQKRTGTSVDCSSTRRCQDVRLLLRQRRCIDPCLAPDRVRNRRLQRGQWSEGSLIPKRIGNQRPHPEEEFSGDYLPESEPAGRRRICGNQQSMRLPDADTGLQECLARTRCVHTAMGR